ncbi:MAG TPA: hypothetical protein VLK22_02550 [Candidatus Udaeobacter sp.]|nr:hypothetical protein [Candidatus Udaeobacter sp.]
MKKVLFAVVFLAVVFTSAVVYLFVLPRSMPSKNITGQNTNGKLKVANFSGKLEKVDTGCFADGECFVQVDGKHITTLLGFNRDTVGSVQGVENFGSLQEIIGKEVNVYAQDKGDGTFTLYGNKDFYIKVK